MRELEGKEKDALEVRAEAAVKRSEQFIGSLRSLPGLKVFRLDLANMEIEEASMDAVVTISGAVKRKIVAETGKMYCQALNKKNAERKFAKQLKTLLNGT